MNRQQRKKFLQEVKADARQYVEIIDADAKTKSKFDARMLRKDWQRVGEDITFGIKKISEELEQDEK